MCPWRVFTTETFWQPFCIHWYNLFSRSTLISRFSWALVSKIASEKRKSGKNWPVPYAKTIFSFFTAFFAEALLRVYELFVYTLQLPEHHVVWLKDPFEVNSFVSPVHWWVQVNYIYSWSDPANLLNREVRIREKRWLIVCAGVSTTRPALFVTGAARASCLSTAWVLFR